MSLTRYPEYKSCEDVVLTTIPVHWEPTSLKRVVALVESGVSVNAVDEPAGPNAIGVLKTSCVYNGSFNGGENKAVVAEELDRVACPVKAGTLIVSRMNTPALVGAAGLVEESADNLFLPDRLWQVHLSGAIPKFAHYWTASPSYRAQVQMACAGTSASMQNLSQDEFLRFVLPLPPQDEQTAITAFLDRETAKIDALIAEQEKLIALLAEKRQATISHAVTRGLNPDAPMKDSGVAWLGEVPEHWILVRVKALSTFTTSGPRGWSERITEEGSLFIQSGDLNDSLGLEFETAKRVNVGDDAEAARTRLANGDVVVCITGAKTGNVALCSSLREPAYVNQHLCLIRPAEGIEGKFLALVLKSSVGQTQFELSQYGLKQGLSLENVRELCVVHPPRIEQQDIVTFIETEMNKLTSLSLAAETGVSLLKERRSALIAAAVTGQIDVRNEVTC